MDFVTLLYNLWLQNTNWCKGKLLKWSIAICLNNKPDHKKAYVLGILPGLS